MVEINSVDILTKVKIFKLIERMPVESIKDNIFQLRFVIPKIIIRIISNHGFFDRECN